MEGVPNVVFYRYQEFFGGLLGSNQVSGVTEQGAYFDDGSGVVCCQLDAPFDAFFVFQGDGTVRGFVGVLGEEEVVLDQGADVALVADYFS